jgi:hypothetical protein
MRTSHSLFNLYNFSVDTSHDAPTVKFLSSLFSSHNHPFASLTTDMGKRKALNDEQFSRQVKKIRNPLVQQAHFHNVGESGVNVTTSTTGRYTGPDRSESAVKPEAMPLHDVASTQEPEDKRKNQTQVKL